MSEEQKNAQEESNKLTDEELENVTGGSTTIPKKVGSEDKLDAKIAILKCN